VARTLELGYLTEEEAATVAEAGYAPAAPLLWLLPLLEVRLPSDYRLAKATELVTRRYRKELATHQTRRYRKELVTHQTPL
jgi:hypothetical protein